MIVKELIQRVQSLYSKGVHSDDTRLTSRHIYNKLLTVRSRLISLQAKKKQKLNQWSFQTIDCIELVSDYDYDCPCIEIGCKILRSKYPLPKPLTDLNSHLIQSVSSIDGNITFTETQFNNKKWKKGSRYAKDSPEYYIKNGYIYIIGIRKVKVISITGLFEDPFEVSKYPSYCGNKEEEQCLSPLDMDFPIDAELIEPLIEISVQELVGVFKQMQQDKDNNSRDDSVSLPKDEQV